MVIFFMFILVALVFCVFMVGGLVYFLVLFAASAIFGEVVIFFFFNFSLFDSDL